MGERVQEVLNDKILLMISISTFFTYMATAILLYQA